MIKSLVLCFALLALASCSTQNLRHEANSAQSQRFMEIFGFEDTNPVFLNESYYVGFEPLDTRGSLFYWLFESRRNPSKDPLIVWLTGGPGCSSELAIFVENGPFKINNKTLELTSHAWAWNNEANMLFVDQPIGTGYSTGSRLDVSEAQIAADFYTFLQEFLKTYPDYNGRDFFITGESYAGHYIPSIASHIVEKGGLNLNFKGVAIGNGLMSVYWQYPGYATFSLENNLVDQKTYNSLVKGFSICQKLVEQGHDTLALIECQTQVQRILGNPPRFNVYDVRLPCEGPLCYDFDFVDKFLAQSKVEKALGVTGRPWAECNNTVHTDLQGDWMTDLTANVTYLVNKGLRVMLYHGDKDFICNWRGGEAEANNLPWSKQSEFANQNYTVWKNYGEYKHLDNFTFLRLYNAGHMVPMDQPEAALAMLSRFVAGW